MDLSLQITITVIVLLVFLIVFIVITFTEAPSNMVKCTDCVEDVISCSFCNASNSSCSSNSSSNSPSSSSNSPSSSSNSPSSSSNSPSSSPSSSSNSPSSSSNSSSSSPSSSSNSPSSSSNSLSSSSNSPSSSSNSSSSSPSNSPSCNSSTSFEEKCNNKESISSDSSDNYSKTYSSEEYNKKNSNEISNVDSSNIEISKNIKSSSSTNETQERNEKLEVEKKREEKKEKKREEKKEKKREEKKEKKRENKKEQGTRRCKIPKRIVQTYRDRELPIKMFQATETFKKLNSDYKYKFYDNDEARSFIEKHCEISVLKAYDSLIPGAFKADVFRLCELYINGGFYVDISMVCLSSLSIFDYIDADLILVKDVPKLKNHIYNAFIGAIPNHPIIKYLLDEVVKNVLLKNMGDSPLDVTGPLILGKKFKDYLHTHSCFSNGECAEIKLGMIHTFSQNNEKEKEENKILILEHLYIGVDTGNFIVVNIYNEEKNIIKTKYEGWRSDRPQGSHYSTLYAEGKVFK